MINFDIPTQANKAMELAIGRIFHLGSRPAKEGDIKSYEDAKYVILCASEYLGIARDDNSHNCIRDIKFSND